MRPNPKPGDSIRGLDAHDAIVNAYARRVKTTDFLEMKRRMPWVALELLVAAIRETLN